MRPHKRILSIDIGGTGLKAAVIDAKGKLISELVRVPTPKPCRPTMLIKTLVALVKPLPRFDCISIGFPGVVRGSRVLTAPNLGTEMYAGFDLGSQLSKALGKPLRLVNDADMQGFAAINGKGLEFAITLGTGFGSALFRDGELMPHMEIAHMLAHDGKSFDEFLGEKHRKKIGNKKWNKRVEKMLPVLQSLLNYDHLYIGGGNAKHVSFRLPRNARIVPNIAGIQGGAHLWRQTVWK
jgi:polyphosphate glucokinase